MGAGVAPLTGDTQTQIWAPGDPNDKIFTVCAVSRYQPTSKRVATRQSHKLIKDNGTNLMAVPIWTLRQ